MITLVLALIQTAVLGGQKDFGPYYNVLVQNWNDGRIAVSRTWIPDQDVASAESMIGFGIQIIRTPGAKTECFQIESVWDGPSPRDGFYWRTSPNFAHDFGTYPRLCTVSFTSSHCADLALSWHGYGGSGDEMSACHGDCDNDNDCATGLYCYHDVGMNGVPPGCTGTAHGYNEDYCFKVPKSTGELVWFSWAQTGGLNACQGDCDNDGQCNGDLKCYHNGVPPGCTGTPVASYADYCYNPLANSAADGFTSGHSDDEPIEDMEPDHVAPNEETVFFDDFVPMILGAAAGAAVIASIVAVVVAMRKKAAAKETEIEMKAVHVPETTNTEQMAEVEVVAAE